ncbi:hypothetical protein C9I57_10315 [Trinickia symbiotica]|uniref:DUF4123 domain-containing protein n=2 Tax=Trinickia symbiotica TaxID=863227 RepID=A0A2T3XX52_9BURK|nr:hypothetical protein C9I57_10315 [Trinickia symbiotica]
MSKLPPMQVTPEPSLPLTHGFLLIEPATMSYEPILQTLAMHPCTPRALTHREELMPRLVDLTSLEPDQQEWVSDIWRGEATAHRPPVICAWLDSEGDVDELAGHIARYLVGPGEDGRPVFWRYYDPRVLSLALAVLDPTQRTAVLGPVTDWQFAWAGHHWRVSGPGTLADDMDGHVPAWPRPDQWPRINCSEIAASVVARLSVMSVEEAVRLPAELDRIFSEVARRGWLRNADALIDYAWHCLRYGQALEQHPAVVEVWSALVRGEVAWRDVKAQLTLDDFRAAGTTARVA